LESVFGGVEAGEVFLDGGDDPLLLSPRGQRNRDQAELLLREVLDGRPGEQALELPRQSEVLQKVYEIVR